MDIAEIEMLNRKRAVEASRALNKVQAFPVLVLGIQPRTKGLVIVGFHEMTHDEIAERLRSYLDYLRDTPYIVLVQ